MDSHIYTLSTVLLVSGNIIGNRNAKSRVLLYNSCSCTKISCQPCENIFVKSEQHLKYTCKTIATMKIKQLECVELAR